MSNISFYTTWVSLGFFLWKIAELSEYR